MSSLSAAVVHGPTRTARVVAGSRLGCYLLVDPPADGATRCVTVLPVLTAAALALPTAVRLPDDALPALEVGDRVEVGAGRICALGWDLEVVRTFRPARVRSRAPHPTAASTDGSGHDLGPKSRQEPSVGDGGGATTVLRALLETRLGLGPGLTPEADDEIAGHLLVAAGRGARVPDLEPHLHRTTALSASLLCAAAQGYAVPAVVGYVDAVLDQDHLTAARLRPTVEAIGHTSGPALVRGILAAAGADVPPAPPLATSAQIFTERTVA